MTYKVTKQYGMNRELEIGQFRDLKLAKESINAKIHDDVIQKIKAIYRIYEWDDLVEEISTDNVSIAEDSSQGQGNKSTFSPTPLSSVPRPAGIPQNWVKDEDDKKK